MNMLSAVVATAVHGGTFAES